MHHQKYTFNKCLSILTRIAQALGAAGAEMIELQVSSLQGNPPIQQIGNAFTEIPEVSFF
jgi:hypothetical protein